MARAGKVTVLSHPVENAFAYVGMNVKQPPFSHPKVRQAVAAPFNEAALFRVAGWLEAEGVVAAPIA